MYVSKLCLFAECSDLCIENGTRVNQNGCSDSEFASCKFAIHLFVRFCFVVNDNWNEVCQDNGKER